MGQEVCVIFATDGCINGFRLLTKYTTNPNRQGKIYSFKDFMSDGVLKMTEPAAREDATAQTTNINAMTSTARTPQPRKDAQ
jgi:hypothetical protein